MSKQVTCVNPRNYALTNGREYTANDSTRAGMYLIINDANREVNYSQDLFEDVQTESTVDQIIDSLRLSINDNLLSITYSIDGGQESRNITIGRGGTSISCGIHMVWSITNLYSQIFNNLTDRDNLRSELFKRCILFLSTIQRTALVLYSTNINGDRGQAICQLMDEIIPNGFESHNPNSGNPIKMWVLDVSEEFLDEGE